MTRRFALAAALALAVVPTLALAQSAVPDTVEGLLALVLEALRNGNHTTAGFLGLLLLVAFARKFGGSVVPWIATDVGGTVLGSIAAPAAVVAAAGLAGQPITGDFVSKTFVLAFAGGGLWTVVRRLVIALALPYVEAGVRRIPVVGTIVVPFVERAFGKVIDGARDALLKRFSREPAEAPAPAPAASSAAPLAAAAPEAERAPAVTLRGRTAEEIEAEQKLTGA